MKLSELRTCDGCGGPLFSPPGRWFQVIRTSGALLSAAAVETVRAAVRHGIPLERLEAIPGTQPEPVVIIGEGAGCSFDELLLCVDCYHGRPIAEAVRKRRERLERSNVHGRVS